MKKTKKLSRLISATTALALSVTLGLQLVPPSRAFAASQITNRSLTLMQGTVDTTNDGLNINDGGSMPGGTVSHEFAFTLNSGGNVGSIKFQYCTTAAAVPNGIDCNPPTGLDTTGASLGDEQGAVGFNANINKTTPGTVIIERSSAQTIAAAQAVSYRLDNIVNPTSPMTFFVRISTWDGIDGTGNELDSGTVAAATSTQIQLGGTMPESLVFCAGASVSLTNGVPDCNTVTTGVVAFDRLFSPTDTALATSQMAASTNATYGYAITVNGPTLTSGTNTITAMGTTDISKHGVSQFGMNLVLNDGTAYTGAPNLSDMSLAQEPNSANVAPASNGTNYRGFAQTGYGAAGNFSFNNNATVADSSSNGATPPVSTGSPAGTDAQIYTASYIVNVPGSQPAGTYKTTLTYICTPTF